MQCRRTFEPALYTALYTALYQHFVFFILFCISFSFLLAPTLTIYLFYFFFVFFSCVCIFNLLECRSSQKKRASRLALPLHSSSHDTSSFFFYHFFMMIDDQFYWQRIITLPKNRRNPAGIARMLKWEDIRCFPEYEDFLDFFENFNFIDDEEKRDEIQEIEKDLICFFDHAKILRKNNPGIEPWY